MRTVTRLVRLILTALALGSSVASWGCAGTTAPDPLAGCTFWAHVQVVTLSGVELEHYDEYRCAGTITKHVYTDGRIEVWH